MISNSLRGCHIIGKANNVGNLELVPVPMSYRDNILTDVGWIEFWTPRLFERFSLGNPSDATGIVSDPVAPERSNASKYV